MGTQVAYLDPPRACSACCNLTSPVLPELVVWQAAKWQRHQFGRIHLVRATGLEPTDYTVASRVRAILPGDTWLLEPDMTAGASGARATGRLPERSARTNDFRSGGQSGTAVTGAGDACDRQRAYCLTPLHSRLRAVARR